MIRVTEAIGLAGLVDTKFMSEHGRDRGTAVHLATALDDAWELDEASVHAEVAPFLDSWRRWRTESGFVVVESEMEVAYPALGYVGHLDRLGTFPGDPRLVVVDIKCGAAAGWHCLQLAAYALAWASGRAVAPTPLRGCVYLSNAGNAGKWVAHKDRKDFDLWKAVLAVAKFKQEHP